jgi:hypothetical protein
MDRKPTPNANEVIPISCNGARKIAVLTHVRGKGSLNEMKVGGTNMPTDVI